LFGVPDIFIVNTRVVSRQQHSVLYGLTLSHCPSCVYMTQVPLPPNDHILYIHSTNTPNLIFSDMTYNLFFFLPQNYMYLIMLSFIGS